MRPHKAELINGCGPCIRCHVFGPSDNCIKPAHVVLEKLKSSQIIKVHKPIGIIKIKKIDGKYEVVGKVKKSKSKIEKTKGTFPVKLDKKAKRWTAPKDSVKERSRKSPIIHKRAVNPNKRCI